MKGSERKLYDLIIKKYDLKDKVFFYEWTDNISEFLNSASLLICPSRHEPFGNVVMNGWAHKIPVVVSDTGGPGALVKNSVNGLKFKNEDFFDLIEKVKYLESKKSLVKKLIKNGYNDYESKFSEQIIINKYIKFLKK